MIRSWCAAWPSDARGGVRSVSKELADQGVSQPRLVADLAPSPLDDEQVKEFRQGERQGEVERRPTQPASGGR